MNDLAPAVERSKKNRPLRISPKLREAIDCSITEGLPWSEAAVKCGLTTRAMRMALGKAHVIRYIQEKTAQFRVEISTRDVFRLAELRDQNENKVAAVNSIRLLRQLGDEDVRPLHTRNVTPGVVVIIKNERAPLAHPQFDQLIEINPASAGELIDG